MVKTKLGEMQVFCANCDPAINIKNYDNLVCDVCGKVAARVTFGELLENALDALEQISSMANIWNEKEVAIANRVLQQTK
jgi:hypothetical protein